MEQVQPTQELSIHLGEDALLDNTVLKTWTEETVHCLGRSLGHEPDAIAWVCGELHRPSRNASGARRPQAEGVRMEAR